MMESPKREHLLKTKGQTMTATESAKTIIVGMALILGLTTAGGAWGILRGVVTSVPVNGGWVFLAVAVIAFLSVPVILAVMKEPASK